MTDLRQAAMLALEALEDLGMKHVENTGETLHADVYTALRTALEQPEQEPVACVIDGDLYFHHEIDWEDLAYQGHGVELLYTIPPAAQRPWVGLTDDEAKEIYNCIHGYDSDKRIARAIEARLKERNT